MGRSAHIRHQRQRRSARRFRLLETQLLRGSSKWAATMTANLRGCSFSHPVALVRQQGYGVPLGLWVFQVHPTVALHLKLLRSLQPVAADWGTGVIFHIRPERRFVRRFWGEHPVEGCFNVTVLLGPQGIEHIGPLFFTRTNGITTLYGTRDGN